MAFGRVLITGGAGFVGSQLLKRIEPLADHVYVIDDLSSGSRDAVISSDKVTFIQGSYYQEDLLEEVLPRVEWIFHLACSSLSSSVIDIKKDYSTNLYGAFVLLEKVRALCPTLHRIVYTSTASVYGNAPVRPTPETYYQITTAYAASKFAAEHYFEMYFRNFRLPVTTVRLSNVFGPGQVKPTLIAALLPNFLNACKMASPSAYSATACKPGISLMLRMQSMPSCWPPFPQTASGNSITLVPESKRIYGSLLKRSLP